MENLRKSNGCTSHQLLQAAVSKVKIAVMIASLRNGVATWKIRRPYECFAFSLPPSQKFLLIISVSLCPEGLSPLTSLASCYLCLLCHTSPLCNNSGTASYFLLFLFQRTVLVILFSIWDLSVFSRLDSCTMWRSASSPSLKLIRLYDAQILNLWPSLWLSCFF